MEFDPTNPLQQRHHSSNRALIQKYFDLEPDFMVARGYSKEQKFIDIRTIAISYIEKYVSDQVDAFVPYLAITYVDRFLSKNIDIPVIKSGEGFNSNLELFVFSCVSIAFKIRCSDFSFLDFWNEHKVGDVRDVLVMELQILEGLKWRVRPLTAITFIYFLLPFLRMEDQQQLLPITTVSQVIVGIQRDIKFTEFRPSTLAAAAILVTSYKLLPGLHSEILRKVFRCGLVLQVEVEQCFEELKEHIIADYILNPDKRPRAFKETYCRWRVRRNKGKELMMEDSATESELISEITKEEEHEEIVMEFDLNWVDPEPEPFEEEWYKPMQQILSCVWPIVCRCFGSEFGR